MKLKEFWITRYGPLQNTERVPLRDFNLFWGRNEDGKTLTIDALTKLLLGKNVKDFTRIDRVEEKPEGYLIMEDERGKEIKLPEKGDLTKVAGLTPSECRNIFVIRNSDLSIASPEGEFYTAVTDRLTGLRTHDISEAKETLRGIAKITPQGAFRNIGDEKLKTRVETAKELVRKVGALAKRIEEEGFGDLEQESVKLEEDIERIGQDLRNLEDARKREEFEKGKGVLDRLTNALEKIKGLEIYNESDQQLWRDSEKEIQRRSEEKEKSLRDLWENEEEFKEESQKVSELERDFQVSYDRKKKLEEIKPDLKTYEIKSGELAQRQGRDKFLTSVGIISAILFGISLLGTIFRPSLLFSILGVLFLISAVITGIVKLQFVREKAWLAGLFERNKLTLARFELDAEDIKGMLSNVQRFEDEYSRKYNELQEAKRRKENLEARIKELRDKTIPDIESKIKGAEKTIQEIKIKSKATSLEEYTDMLESKQKVENSIGEQRSILRSHFGEKNKTLEENISCWSEEIGKLEEYRDKAKDMKYSETTASTLAKRKGECEGNLTEVKEKLGSLRKEMEEVEREANEILKLEEPLYCETSVDLKAIKDRIQSFVEKNESNKDNALKAIEIFEEIEREEKAKVSELFGSESPISNYFNEITNGLYEDVLFDQETGKIQVKRKDGKMLAAEKLSGGAYDQLYLSIRLALGEKLLKDKRGFFIMDDPLVKADPDRLQRQIQTLRKISELGWQVIYFSAKGEIKDVLEEDIKEGTINYVEVRGIFS